MMTGINCYLFVVIVICGEFCLFILCALMCIFGIYLLYFYAIKQGRIIQKSI